MTAKEIREEIYRHEKLAARAQWLLYKLEEDMEFVKKEYNCYYTTTRGPLVVKPDNRTYDQIHEQLVADRDFHDTGAENLKQQYQQRTGREYVRPKI